MGKIDVICVGAAIVDIPLQPVSKNIFDVDSYPLERIAMTTGGDAINEAMIISRLGHKTALNSRIGNDAAGHFILERCRQENIDIYSLRMDEGDFTRFNRIFHRHTQVNGRHIYGRYAYRNRLKPVMKLRENTGDTRRQFGVHRNNRLAGCTRTA